MKSVALSQDTVWSLIHEEMKRRGYDVQKKPCSISINTEKYRTQIDSEDLKNANVVIHFDLLK